MTKEIKIKTFEIMETKIEGKINPFGSERIRMEERINSIRDERTKIGERINTFARENRLNDAQLALELGMQQVTVNNYMRGRRRVSCEFVEAILNRFKNLSAEWLMRGEGEMLKKDVAQTYNYSNVFNAQEAAKTVIEENQSGKYLEYISKFADIIEKQQIQMAKMIDIIATEK